jgi:alkanesulfonate monooxygenase SsuD/methylene tetrahydromethanopterin reductase-like flavin-dependent oxidoreductase (luciferase family)
VVNLAVFFERVGLDLVTFPDHPYQSAFLDTWTLISWVAARTERIHLTGSVVNLPMRQPAVRRLKQLGGCARACAGCSS